MQPCSFMIRMTSLPQMSIYTYIKIIFTSLNFDRCASTPRRAASIITIKAAEMPRNFAPYEGSHATEKKWCNMRTEALGACFGILFGALQRNLTEQSATSIGNFRTVLANRRPDTRDDAACPSASSATKFSQMNHPTMAGLQRYPCRGPSPAVSLKTAHSSRLPLKAQRRTVSSVNFWASCVCVLRVF